MLYKNRKNKKGFYYKYIKPYKYKKKMRGGEMRELKFYDERADQVFKNIMKTMKKKMLCWYKYLLFMGT